MNANQMAINYSLREFEKPFVYDSDSTCMGIEMQLVAKKAKDIYEWNKVKLPKIIRVNLNYNGNGVPVGSIEFVENVMLRQNMKIPPPLDVPKKLKSYLGTNVFIGMSDVLPEINKTLAKFQYKRLDKTKSEWFKIEPGEDSPKEDKPIPVRITVWRDFCSEWRIFVYNREIMRACCYIGNPVVFPNGKIIESMIAEFDDCPPSYTLDVGVNENNGQTQLVETHHFYGCVLYGFQEPVVLKMWADWYAWWLKYQAGGGK